MGAPHLGWCGAPIRSECEAFFPALPAAGLSVCIMGTARRAAVERLATIDTCEMEGHMADERDRVQGEELSDDELNEASGGFFGARFPVTFVCPACETAPC